MRTTLTLDDDVAHLVKEEVRRSGESFKEAVNRMLRLGVIAAREPHARKQYVVTPKAMGLKPGLSYDCTAELLEEAEGPNHR